jgi:hypothetical protein
MSLSKQSLETLIDLIEIKLSCIEVWDRDDARELARLKQARVELLGLAGRSDTLTEMGEVVALPQRRRGRPRNIDRQPQAAVS